DRVKAMLNTSVTGRLFLTENGAAPQGAGLTLIDEDQGVAYDADALTDGTFVFPTVVAGTYQLEVDGFVLPTPVTVTVASTAVDLGNIDVDRGAIISGNVVLATNGAPIVDSVVAAVSIAGDVFTTRTDGTGAYEFDGLPTGEYTLTTGGGTLSTTQVDVQIT